MIVAHLPPNSRMHGTKFFAAYIATSRPVLGDPVKKTISNGNLLTHYPTFACPSIHR